MVSVWPQWWQTVGGPRDKIWDFLFLALFSRHRDGICSRKADSPAKAPHVRFQWRRHRTIVCCAHWRSRTSPPWSRTSRRPCTVRGSPWLTTLRRPPHWPEDRGCTGMRARGQMPQLSPSARAVVTGACTSRPPSWRPKRWWRKICQFAPPGSWCRQLAARSLSSCVKTSVTCLSCSSSLHHFQRTRQVSRFPSWQRSHPSG